MEQLKWPLWLLCVAVPLDNAFAILDEAQNATESQLKMFVTRMGRSAKFIVTGDITQIDLPQKPSKRIASGR